LRRLSDLTHLCAKGGPSVTRSAAEITDPARTPLLQPTASLQATLDVTFPRALVDALPSLIRLFAHPVSALNHVPMSSRNQAYQLLHHMHAARHENGGVPVSYSLSEADLNDIGGLAGTMDHFRSSSIYYVDVDTRRHVVRWLVWLYKRLPPQEPGGTPPPQPAAKGGSGTRATASVRYVVTMSMMSAESPTPFPALLGAPLQVRELQLTSWRSALAPPRCWATPMLVGSTLSAAAVTI
jgi:hypothetical protein